MVQESGSEPFSTEVVTELIKVNYSSIILLKFELKVQIFNVFFLMNYFKQTSSFLQESVSAVIGESQYSVSQVEGWAKTIAETISSSTQKLEHTGYKFIINVMLVQKTDGGIQVTLLFCWIEQLRAVFFFLMTQFFSNF